VHIDGEQAQREDLLAVIFHLQFLDSCNSVQRLPVDLLPLVPAHWIESNIRIILLGELSQFFNNNKNSEGTFHFESQQIRKISWNGRNSYHPVIYDSDL
jgi:hypothetical protein